MDGRVVELGNRLFAYASEDYFPAPAFREEIVALHAAVSDEASRIKLMRFFNVVADIVQLHLETEGGDVAAFKRHRVERIHKFLLDECRAGERIDVIRLREVTLREIKAARMHEEDTLRRYALGDENAFRPN